MKKESANIIRRVGTLLFVIYIVALVYFLFFAEEYGRRAAGDEFRYNLVLFQEIRRFIEYRHVVGTFALITNVAGNVIGFIPFGMILPIIYKRTRKFMFITILSFELSLFVEITQLIFRVGCFDVDDLLLNTVGGMIGYFLFYMCNKIRRKYYG